MLFCVATAGAQKSSGQDQQVIVKGPTDFTESSLSPEHIAAAKELQGEWTVVAFHSAGRVALANPDLVKKSLGTLVTDVFEGNKLITLTPLKTRVEIEYRLDPAKEPKRIDQRFTGGRIGPWIAKGIYKLEGDVLTICYGDPNVGRPTDFITKPGDGRKMNVYRRLKEQNSKER
jgi:uncharacterized protein (TIGR03067 family)